MVIGALLGVVGERLERFREGSPFSTVVRK